MATKCKNRKKRRPPNGLFQQAQRQYAKGNFKQALKDARLCFRQESSEEHLRFLQRACLARAQQLYRSGLRSQCRAIVEDLLEIGVTEPSVQEELPQLLVAVGLFDRVSTGGEESSVGTDSQLLLSAADHAVLRPDEAPASLPGVRQGALAIRAALNNLNEGKESEAVAGLRQIARGSPFADWKYFVRGLAAYYRNETTEMRENWDRLDSARFAARIAVPLTSLADHASTERNDRRVRAMVAKIEAESDSGPILTALHELQDCLAANRPKQALRSLRGSRAVLQKFDPDVLSRVSQVLCSVILRRGLESLLRKLTLLVDPPPIDPHWNRARALACEYSAEGDPKRAESYWVSYLDDLAELPCLSPQERTLARALVWQRIGANCVEEHEAPYLTRSQSVQLQDRAQECFTNSLQLDAKLLSSYKALTAAQMAWKKPDEAAETCRRLLEHFPEDFDALMFLAQHHIVQDEPFPARDYLLRARRLKPTNKPVLDLMRAVHVSAARHYTVEKRYEQGRAEFDAAEKLNPPELQRYFLLARRALLEFKAGEFALGQRLVDRARSEAGEPASILLVLAIDAGRYALSGQFAADYERQWQAALKKKCNGTSAGRMCQTMTAYQVRKVDRPGWSRHVESLATYLHRCSRVKWQADDLQQVCMFLEAISVDEEFDEEYDLLEKLVRKGRKLFPERPVFHSMTGELEIANGPWECDRPKAIACFQQALELAKDSTDPIDAAVLKHAKSRLTFLGEAGLGFHGFVDDYDDEYDDEYDDDDDDDDDGYDGEYDEQYSERYDDQHDTGPFTGPPPLDFFDFFKQGNDRRLDTVEREVMKALKAMCAATGDDMEEVLRQVIAGMPPDSRGDGRQSRRKQKKKRKR